jgi:hypothetical protein
MIKKRLAIIALCLSIGLALGLSVHQGIEVYLNGQLLQLNPPARLEQDSTMIPLRPIAEALGAEVIWDAQFNTVLLEKNVWLEVDHEPNFGTTTPFETKALGPILSLRYYLAERQWNSVQSQKGDEPFLARFEIIDAYSHISPPGFLGELKTISSEAIPYLGYSLTALLYWAYPDSPNSTSIQATVVKRERLKEGTAVGQLGPSISKVRIEVKQYYLEPESAVLEESEGDVTLVTIGAEGWKVQELPDTEVLLRSLSSSKTLPPSRIIDLSKENTMLPFYDLSTLILQ